MMRRGKICKTILVSILSLAMVMTSLNYSGFKVMAEQLENETEETNTVTDIETTIETIETTTETVIETTTESEDNAEIDEDTDKNYGELWAEGNCGASYVDEVSGETKIYDVKWAIYDSNTDQDDTIYTNDLLVISGNGKMKDYTNSNKAPWTSRDYMPKLKKVIIESGVENIGDYAFYTSTTVESNIETVEIADTVKSIGSCAFYWC